MDELLLATAERPSPVPDVHRFAEAVTRTEQWRSDGRRGHRGLLGGLGGDARLPALEHRLSELWDTADRDP